MDGIARASSLLADGEGNDPPTVAGAVALYKASRPTATPADVKDALQHLGNLDYKTSTDPDGNPDKLLDVSRIRRGEITLRRQGFDLAQAVRAAIETS